MRTKAMMVAWLWGCREQGTKSRVSSVLWKIHVDETQTFLFIWLILPLQLLLQPGDSLS